MLFYFVNNCYFFSSFLFLFYFFKWRLALGLLLTWTRLQEPQQNPSLTFLSKLLNTNTETAGPAPFPVPLAH